MKFYGHSFKPVIDNRYNLKETISVEMQGSIRGVFLSAVCSGVDSQVFGDFSIAVDDDFFVKRYPVIGNKQDHWTTNLMPFYSKINHPINVTIVWRNLLPTLQDIKDYTLNLAMLYE